MNQKTKETVRKISVILLIVFDLLTIVGAVLVFTRQVHNPGFAVVPAILAVLSGVVGMVCKQPQEQDDQPQNDADNSETGDDADTPQ